MTDPDILQRRFPDLMDSLPRVELAILPTPVEEKRLEVEGRSANVWIKADDLTGRQVGGNKLRKLEYLFGDIDREKTSCVATYGAVASNHALTTALTATRLSLKSIAFLSHQSRTALARQALGWHQRNGTEIVPFAGKRPERVALQRQHLWRRGVSVIAPGGSSWRGTAGFVNAGLELAAQVRNGELPCPDRIYMAAGTLGSVAGMAIGLALAGMPSRVEAVRVSHSGICNRDVLRRLCTKTCTLLNRRDRCFPVDAWRRIDVRLRDEFFAPGYARASPETLRAVDLFESQTGLKLEETYTGKAAAALLSDFGTCAARGEQQLFWNTYHELGQPPPFDDESGKAVDKDSLPEAFLGYLD